MASYATTTDVQSRLTRTLSDEELTVCAALLEDAAILIDSYNDEADEDVKLVVSCRMVLRAIGTGGGVDVPMGATQGSMSGLGYSQSWTISSGSVGELYINKVEKRLLGVGNKIGSYSPLEELVEE